MQLQRRYKFYPPKEGLNVTLSELKWEIEDTLENIDEDKLTAESYIYNPQNELSQYLSPPPDVFPETPYETPTVMLGSYTFMHSPGVIKLYYENLEDFFWQLVHKFLGYSAKPLEKDDLVAMSEFVVKKTYYHEMFHFHCDVLRNLMFTPARFDCFPEEGLAVASSRLHIARDRADKRTRIGKMSDPIFDFLWQEAYDYQSAGYRDYPLYEDNEGLFMAGLIDSMTQKEHHKLISALPNKDFRNLREKMIDLAGSVLDLKEGFQEEAVG